MAEKEINSAFIRNLIFQRRSTRNFDESRAIPQASQEKIISAGMQAPSPKNRQPWHFYVADQPEIRQKIAITMRDSLERLKRQRMQRGQTTVDLEMAEQSADIIEKAPVLLLIGYERDLSNEHGEKLEWELTAQAFEVADLQAIGAAVQNMLLQAEEMGIASLWICDVLYAHDELRDLLQLRTPFIAAVAFGYSENHQGYRKPLAEKAEWLILDREDDCNV